MTKHMIQNAIEARDIRMRPMGAGDIDAVLRLQTLSYPPGLQEGAELFARILENAPSFCFAAQDAGGSELAGYLFAYPAQADRNDYEQGWRDPGPSPQALYIHDLCVHPDRQGRGLAQAMLAEMPGAARAAGLSQLICVAIETAIPFWEKQGFERVRPHPYHHARADYMRRAL